ncbi:MAG: sigma-70 family RNA polymerase sigma factor [Gemmataceae bacterium]|nr:sigma-70 family RNA polymerase sigma factor [Gemmataceae bacterium]
MATNNPMGRVIQHLRTAVLREGAGMTDRQLLQSFVAHRDEAAFAALVRRHGPMVWGVCRRLLGHDQDAEDAFQATFLVLVRKAAAMASCDLLANWLYGVAYHTALKARAVRARRRARERQVPQMPEPEAVPPDLWHELQPLLDQELSRLPDKYRVPIVLCDLEGKTRKEAARQLGVPEGTVAGRLARARALLAQRLTRQGGVLSGGVLAVVLAQSAAAASVPTALVSSTVKAASLLAAGSAAATGGVSTTVAALTEGVVKAMLLTKLKVLTTVLLAVALLGSGGGLLTYRTLRAEPKDAKPAGPPAAAAPGEEKPKPDKEALQGTWVGVSGEREGQKVPEDQLWKLVFEGEKVALVNSNSLEREGSYTIDPDRKPKEIDLTLGSLFLTGIYELKGTTLKTLWRENDRGGLPKEFDSKHGILMVFEKKK